MGPDNDTMMALEREKNILKQIKVHQFTSYKGFSIFPSPSMGDIKLLHEMLHKSIERVAIYVV
jgi:hypothetical protein